MLITLTWLRLDGLRRWRSLAVLALLIALATATILTSIAGARRGQTAFDRLWARTLPATATVLPNQPGFDWAKVAALPEVAALTKFPVVFGFEAQGYPAASTGFPLADDQMTRTIERPVIVAGRLFNPRRADEVIVTPKFAASSGKHVGDTLTLELASVQQANQEYDGSTGPPLGPKIRVRIVGVGRTPWGLDADTPGSPGGILTTPALFTRYRANMMGTNGQAYINALVRLKGGQAAIPAFRADLARVTGRSDIDVWDNLQQIGDPMHKVSAYEAACLLAFGLAALAAALFLIGQSVARYTSATVADLQVLQALGMTRAAGHRRRLCRARPGRGGRQHAGRGGRHRGFAMDADRPGFHRRAAPRHRRGLARPGPRVGPGAAAGAGRVGGRGGGRAGRGAAAGAAAPVRDRGGAGRRELPGPAGGRGQVRARARPRAVLRAGPVGPGGRRRRRARGAGRLHLLGRCLRRGQPPGPVRADLAADHVPRLQRAGLRAGQPRAAGRGRRPGRDRGGRRAHRRRAVRPGLHRELHLRPGGRQAAGRGAHGRADARPAGRDRAGPDDRPGTARRDGLRGPAHRRRHRQARGTGHRHRLRSLGAAQRVRGRSLAHSRRLRPDLPRRALRVQVPRRDRVAAAGRGRAGGRAPPGRRRGRDPGRQGLHVHAARSAAGGPGDQGPGTAAASR